MQIQYRQESYLVTTTQVDCPVQHLICCEGFTMLNGQCIGKIIGLFLQIKSEINI